MHKGTYLLSLKTMEINDPQAASPETKKIVQNILRWQKYPDAKTMNAHIHTHANLRVQTHKHRYTDTHTHTHYYTHSQNV